MEVIPGVHLIAGLSQVYLFEDADRLTLIDTGLTTSEQAILDAIASIGQRPEDLAQIVITHAHPDHAGSLAALAERSGAQVLAHRLEAPVVRGERDWAPPVFESDLERKLFERITPLTPPAPPCRVDRELEDGDEIDLGGGARVLHVPGHTAGSIAIHVPSRRVLFSGDTIERDLEDNVIVGVFNADPAQTRTSFRRLAQLDFEVACFGHGRPLDREASFHVRRVVEMVG